MGTSLDQYARLSQPAPRLRVDLVAAFVAGAGAERPARVVNVSYTGCYLRTPEPAPVGSRVRVSITVPPELGADPVAADAVVRWINPERAPVTSAVPPGMGVQFITLAAAARPALVRLLEQCASTQLALARDAVGQPDVARS